MLSSRNQCKEGVIGSQYDLDKDRFNRIGLKSTELSQLQLRISTSSICAERGERY